MALPGRGPAGSRVSAAGGFTLVEILVSLVILSISLVAILGAFQVSLHSLVASRDSLISNVLLAEKLAEVRQFALENPSQDPGASSGRFSGAYAGYQWEQSVGRVEAQPVENLDGQGMGSLHEVAVNVWSDGIDRKHTSVVRVWTRAPSPTGP